MDTCSRSSARSCSICRVRERVHVVCGEEEPWGCSPPVLRYHRLRPIKNSLEQSASFLVGAAEPLHSLWAFAAEALGSERVCLLVGFWASLEGFHPVKLAAAISGCHKHCSCEIRAKNILSILLKQFRVVCVWTPARTYVAI